MKWLEVDPNRIFKLRITIQIIVSIVAFIYLSVLMIIFLPSEIGNEKVNVPLAIFIISPFVIGFVGCVISDKILYNIGCKASKLQMEQYYYTLYYSQALQYTALREQVVDGGYCDDEYLEEYIL